MLFQTSRLILPLGLKFVRFAVVLSFIYGKIPTFLSNYCFGVYMSIIDNVLSKVVGSRHDRVIKKFTKLVAEINSFEKEHASHLATTS